MQARTTLRALIVTAGFLLLSCGGEQLSSPPPDVPQCEGKPSGGVYAAFRVGNETFHASITNPATIDQAIALWQGRSRANIPNGNLVCQPVGWNCGWSWYLDPDSVEFPEVTAEVCDGLPSHVEKGCTSFGGGSFCPWSAKLLELRDCRTDLTCPAVPR